MIAAIKASPTIKFCPEDFLVFESLAVRMNDMGIGPYQYLRMRTRGLTTFEAIAMVAEFGGLARQDVTYAGLKDEDAITDQYICISGRASPYPTEAFNAVHREEQTFIQLIRSHEPASACHNSRGAISVRYSCTRSLIRHRSAGAGSGLRP